MEKIRKKHLIIMKLLLMVTVTFFCFLSSAQRNLHVYIGSGFEGKKCSLDLNYFNKSDELIPTNYIKDSIFIDNNITGLTCYKNISFPRKYKKELYFTVEDKKYRFCFDKLSNNSGLRIEMYGDVIDYVLLKKNNFQFY